MNSPAMSIPRPALRALHSGYIDFLIDLDPDLRDSFMVRTGGMEYKHFMAAVFDGRLGVSTRIRDDAALIGIAIPLRGRFDGCLFEIPGADGGVDAAWLMAAGSLGLDDDLAELLGES